MAGFDPDVFGGTAPRSAGFDPDVFNAPAMPPVGAGTKAAPAAAKQPKPSFDLRGEGFERLKNYDPTDSIGGMVRGAGSIGATAMAPFDVIEDALKGKGLSLDSNRERRAGMDSGLQELGVDTNSTQFKANKLGAEVLGTMGVSGAVANLLGRIPGATTQIPSLLNAIRTGGMTTGAPAGASRVADMATRVAGGTVSGGATAGAVDPEYASTGMKFGGAFPVAARVLGGAADTVGGWFRGPATNPTKLQTAKEAMDAGYVIPPSQIKPTLGNRIIESTSGKLATQQIASTKNQAVSESLSRKALGLPPDAPLTQETMAAVRKEAGQVYQQLKGTGMVTADQAYLNAVDDIGKTIKSATASFPKLGKTDMHGKPIDEISDLVKAMKVGQFESGGAVDTIAVLRGNADAAYAGQNKSLGRAYKAAAEALEDALDRHLQKIGATDLLPAYREARARIAKSYTVQKAIREGSGTVDARVYGRELQKGKPLTGELLTAGRFANTFDKAAQPPHLIGSPGVHNLTSMFSTGAGAAGAAAGAAMAGPGGAAIGAGLGAAYPYVVPPLARSIMFRQGAQRGLLSQGGSPGLLSSSIDEALPLMYRVSPLLASRSGQ